MKKRMSSLDIDSLLRYSEHIRSLNGSKELISLINSLTIGETYFFRNNEHWRALKEFVLPQILDSRSGNDRSITIWSAGCSTGEEPYSIAITLRENLPFFETWNIKIIGTDINQESIEKAKEGIYTKNSFRGVDDYLIEKYFTKEKEQYRIEERIRQMVEFEVVNLISKNDFPPKYRGFDIIFCRNVLMYFRQEGYREIVDRFAGCLTDGGFLFLGHAEGGMVANTIFENIHSCNTFIFQKRPADCGLKEKSKQIQEFGSQNQAARKSEIQNQTNPPSAIGDRHYEEALKYYYQEDFDAVLKALSRTGDEGQKVLKELILTALICINMSDLDRAEVCREQALKISDTSPEVYIIESMIKEAKGDYDGAIVSAQSAIFLDRHLFIPQFRLGHIYHEMGEYRKAKRCFTNALKALNTDDQERIKLFCVGCSKALLADICRRKIAS